MAEAIILNLLNGVSMRGRGRYPFFIRLKKDTFELGFGAAINFLSKMITRVVLSYMLSKIDSIGSFL